MSNIMFWIRFRIDALREDHERGAAAVEYGLLVGLIAVAIILAVTALGGQLRTMFCDVVNALPVDASPEGCAAAAGGTT